MQDVHVKSCPSVICLSDGLKSEAGSKRLVRPKCGKRESNLSLLVLARLTAIALRTILVLADNMYIHNTRKPGSFPPVKF